MTANTSTFETIASTNYIDLYSLNDTPFKVKIYSAFIPVDDDPQCGNFACITYPRLRGQPHAHQFADAEGPSRLDNGQHPARWSPQLRAVGRGAPDDVVRQAHPDPRPGAPGGVRGHDGYGPLLG